MGKNTSYRALVITLLSVLPFIYHFLPHPKELSSVKKFYKFTLIEESLFELLLNLNIWPF